MVKLKRKVAKLQAKVVNNKPKIATFLTHFIKFQAKISPASGKLSVIFSKIR